MSDSNISMSLTPPGELRLTEKIGYGILAIGLLSMIVAFVGTGAPAHLPFLFGMTALVFGGVLLTKNVNRFKNISLVLMSIGLLSLVLVFVKIQIPQSVLTFLVVGCITAGGLTYIIGRFYQGPAGIRNNHIAHSQWTMKNGVMAWILGIVLTGFYVLLYWYPHNLQGLINATNPIAQTLFHRDADQWFMYGLFYTLAVIVMGTRFAIKYRHNRYQLIRTMSVTFFQLVIAFLLPQFMRTLNQPELYFSYFWPLDYDVLFPSNLKDVYAKGALGQFFVFWTIAVSIIAVPVLTYYFGKRWYCSFVCGCGGLAETAGDPFRQHSDKSLKAWRIERILVHSVLVLITVITIALFVDWKLGFLGETAAGNIKTVYGFFIGSIFAGVIGTGFYPLLGSRVWCRFGCPQAAVLGILQKYFSRFRITTNGSQCISCGNCSTYCEMGIDVRWYAQRGQNIVRASCVGCGICSAVCPRGVLNLENGPVKDRTVIHISRDEIGVIG